MRDIRWKGPIFKLSNRNMFRKVFIVSFVTGLRSKLASNLLEHVTLLKRLGHLRTLLGQR